MVRFSQPPNAFLMSAKSLIPRLGVPSLDSVTSVTADTRARSGQSPPAASATASNGSHTSASRSAIPSGMSGQAPVTNGSTCRAQIARASYRCSPSGVTSRRRKGSTDSSGARRRIRTTTARVMIVSGRPPSPARATAPYAGISSVSMILPRTTHRPATVPRRWPALRRPRISSLSLARGPKTVSISSNKIVGRPASAATFRKRYAGVTLMASTGLGTSSSVTSKARVLPLPGSGDRNTSRGVDSQESIRWVC